MHALIVGGTRFIGRHLVEDLLTHEYDVTIMTRGVSPNPFTDRADVGHVAGDRNEKEALERARDAVDPDVVVDMVALVPEQVEMILDVFADVEAYVLVSTGSVYAEPMIPLREDDAPIHEYTDEYATDEMPTVLEDGMVAGYGPRKAECERVVFAAADRGVDAMVARPSFVYGPYDYLERMDYWIDRVATYNRVVVPGDGDYLFDPVFAPDLAAALRLIAERGTPGEAYNVADRTVVTRDGLLRHVADALDTDLDIVHATEATLDEHGLDVTDFPLTLPFPLLIDTAKLAALGWESTPPKEALARTVDEHLDSDRTGRHNGPDRAVEETLIEATDATTSD